MLFRIVVAAALLSAFPHHASASLHTDQLEVDAGHLERDPSWLALLHYRERGDGSMLSEADRPEFFLSPNGKQAPGAELRAALAAMHDAERQRDFACRFPARYEWLRTRLGHGSEAGVIEQCPLLAHWLANFAGRRMSINFASSYLENPSSTFGHTFLRIVQQSSNELLSPTINYAARSDPRDGQLTFMFKGLFGGFPGVADELPFYRRLRTYAEIEGRDIHEFDLNLTADEVRTVLLHTWEVRDGVFDYFFIDENCAYRTLALLDVARPQAGLLKQFTAATVPVDTIRALRSAGMLGEHRVWPSVPRQVRSLESLVTAQEAGKARQIALGEAGVDDLDVLTPARRSATLQLAYEYGSVLIDRDEGERSRRKDIFGAVARARLVLDVPNVLQNGAPQGSPEDGHDGALLAAGIRRLHGRDGISLEYAMFRHTLTDPLSGYEPHAEISVLNPELYLQGGQVRLQRIDWLVAASTIPSSALFSPRAWRFQLSTRRAPFADRDHLATSLAYHSGKAWRLTDDTVCSVLPGVALEVSAAHAHDAALAAALHAAVTRQGAEWSAQLALRADKFIAGSTLARTSAQLTGELRLSRNMSMVISGTQAWSPRRERDLGVYLKWHHRSLGYSL
jgi:hypothetical protein